LLAAVAAGAWIYYMNRNDAPDSAAEDSTASTLPPDPAGRQAAVNAALRSQDLKGMKPEPLMAQGIVETARFMSKEFPLTLSIWNWHVGSGSGDWSGRVCMKNDLGVWTVYASEAEARKVDPNIEREHLRCYDSLEQCVRDYVGHISTMSIYHQAYVYAVAGDVANWAKAIVTGNGVDGFVGRPNTKKGADYTAALVGTYNEEFA
jgi:hypothetical protein